MKTLLAGLFMTVVLVFVNIVAAGVTMLLGTQLNQHGVETHPMLWIIIMAAATWCAITFMVGAIQQARHLSKRTRS